MRFDVSQLEKWIETEISFLRYYGNRVDRKSLTIDSNIYSDIRSIGYTKRVMPLYYRCSPVLIESDVDLNKSKISDLFVTGFGRSEKSFTPCEVFIKLYPNRKYEIINILKSEEINPITKIKI